MSEHYIDIVFSRPTEKDITDQQIWDMLNSHVTLEFTHCIIGQIVEVKQTSNALWHVVIRTCGSKKQFPNNEWSKVRPFISSKVQTKKLPKLVLTMSYIKRTINNNNHKTKIINK